MEARKAKVQSQKIGNLPILANSDSVEEAQASSSNTSVSKTSSLRHRLRRDSVVSEHKLFESHSFYAAKLLNENNT